MKASHLVAIVLVLSGLSSFAATAADIEGWDSLMHINLVVAVEQRFDIRFSTADIASFECVGDIKNLIARSKAA